MFNNTKSFSLIEVLIFVSILSIFFVVATTVTVVSLRNMKISEHKILATRYAEEALEWLRDKKEADWTNFLTEINNYCFNISPISDNWPATGACGSNNYLVANSQTTIFLRNIQLQNQDNQININVTVSWQELGGNYQVPLATVFTVWED